MRVLHIVAAAVVALSLAASAAAAAPDGFRDSGRLAPIAAAVSGKPGVVYCAKNFDAWAALIRPGGGDPAKVLGYVPPTDDVVYLNVPTCQRLEGWLRGRNAPTLRQLGVAVLTLTHESMHVRGVDDEGATDCAALAAMPRVLRVHFKVLKAATRKTAMDAAWREHWNGGAAYQGDC